MSEKYKQFLQLNNVISEKDFNKLLEELPADIDLSSADWDGCDLDEIEGIAEQLIQAYLNQKTSTAWCDDVSYKNKFFELYDIESLEELETIKNSFSNWNIRNSSIIAQALKEKDANQRFNDLIDYIRLNANLEQLEKFVNNYLENEA